jgi:hypothetical protein
VAEQGGLETPLSREVFPKETPQLLEKFPVEIS